MAKGKRLKPTPPTQPAAPTITPGPLWPAFEPQLPVTDLVPETVIPDKVVVYRTFFPRSLCRDYVSFLRDLPLTLTPGKPKRGEALRVNDRYQIDDPSFADRLWAETGLRDAILHPDMAHLWGGEVLGLNANIRVYRYQKGHFFDAHYDDANIVTLRQTDQGSDQLVPAKTTWTLLLYLTSSSEGCNGGETVFYPFDRRSAKEEIAVSPETGMLLLHKHGNDCLLHEGREVTAGEKWILRTDLPGGFFLGLLCIQATKVLHFVASKLAKETLIRYLSENGYWAVWEPEEEIGYSVPYGDARETGVGRGELGMGVCMKLRVTMVEVAAHGKGRSVMGST